MPYRQIDPDVLEVLRQFSLEGDRIINVPTAQVDPKIYAAVKKILTANYGRWCGGKKQHFEFPCDITAVWEDLCDGKLRRIKNEQDAFFTPPAVTEFMCDILLPCEPQRILEPSAGEGRILDYLVENFPADHEIHCIEPHPMFRERLEAKGYSLVGTSFEELPTSEKYDIVIANPPFKPIKGHVRKIAQHLLRSGSATIVIPASFDTTYPEVMEELRGKFESVSCYDLPEGSFKESGTGVSTKVLALRFLKADAA